MNKKIIIAEDEKPIAKALQLKLEHEGYQVTVAGNGQEAIDLLSKEHFDLLLLDLVMPIKDGFTALQEIRSKSIDVPVIITSNLSQSVDIQKAKSLGVIEFIVKADTPLADIIKLVNNVLG